MRKSLDLRNWETGQKLVRDWEAGGHQSVTVSTACDRFFADCEVRGLRAAQLGKYKLLVDDLKHEFGNRLVGGITVDDLRSYREDWNLSPVSAGKKLERLRTFFKFCNESGWIQTNPARVLKAPKVKETKKTPFTASELEEDLMGH